MFLKDLNKGIEKVKIYRQSSNMRKRKRCFQFLHYLEPLGIEILKETDIDIIILAKDIKGSARLFIHDVENLKLLSYIQVGIKTTINTKKLKGELFFSIQTLEYELGDNKPFDVEIVFEIDKTSYINNPIYDIRKEKISDNVINDEDLFVEKVLNGSNREHGMLMISDNVRVYMPLSKYIPKDLKPSTSLGLYEKIVKTYNELCGFDKNDEREIFKPREGFILISARRDAGIGSIMIDTLPENSALYFKDYWMIFFNFAHMFEAYWSVINVWTSMYSKYMANRTIGFTWLWGNDRSEYEKEYILCCYQNYFDKYINEEKPLDIKKGLYMFIALEEVLGCDFLSKLDIYCRENNLPKNIKGMEYILLVIAKIYGINVIPYAEIYGTYIKDLSIVYEIIDNSTSTLIYIPKNCYFEKYEKASMPVTVKGVYFSSQVIEGISNKGSSIKFIIKNNTYYRKADNDGKFKFKIPMSLELNEKIIITSTEIGKIESPPKIINLIDDSNQI